MAEVASRGHPSSSPFSVLAESNYTLPPRIPPAPFKVDFTMFVVTTASPTTAGRILESAEFLEYMDLRRSIKDLELELITAQTTVDDELKFYHSTTGKKKAEISTSWRQRELSDAEKKLKFIEANHFAAYLKFISLTLRILTKTNPTTMLPDSTDFKPLSTPSSAPPSASSTVRANHSPHTSLSSTSTKVSLTPFHDIMYKNSNI